MRLPQRELSTNPGCFWFGEETYLGNDSVYRMDCHGLGIKGVCIRSSLPELETFLLIILQLKFSEFLETSLVKLVDGHTKFSRPPQHSWCLCNILCTLPPAPPLLSPVICVGGTPLTSVGQVLIGVGIKQRIQSIPAPDPTVIGAEIYT